MKRVATFGVSTRAVRDFIQVARGRPFRVALVLSLIAHLVLLVVFGSGKLGRAGEGERRIPGMRVHLVAPE